MEYCKVCAVVPLYNEQKYAKDTIEELLNLGRFDCIVAVDDGSTDRTWDILCSIDQITKTRHKKNAGKAEAVYDGIACCSADIYVLIDGDLGHSARNIKPLIDMVINGSCDVCIADLPSRPGYGGIGFLRRFSKYMVKKCTGVDFPCPMSGQRAVRDYVLKDSRFRHYHGYGLEVGMLVDCIKSGYRVDSIKLELTHNATGRDIYGFLHRFKQFADILRVFI